MLFDERWHIIEEFDQGGQGKVYRVLDLSKFEPESHHKSIFQSFSEWIGSFTAGIHPSKESRYEAFKKAVLTVQKMEDPSNHGAMKVLHKPEDARDAELAEDRIKNEIRAMSEIEHPNLLRILDHDLEYPQRFVSEFQTGGTLAKNRTLFAGDFASALRAFRPLVDAVALLHRNKQVHRDIKPENIFISSEGNLVLGDFGLIFFTDDNRTRVSRTFENVGSRDWMPLWAQGMRIEDVSPAFDVFSLGKVLWSMVSAQPKLLGWYVDSPNYPNYNLEGMFPDSPFINFANPILKKCLAEFQNEILQDANSLLAEIDETLAKIEVRADPIDPNVERLCKVCGVGTYRMVTKGFHPSEVENFGLSPHGHQKFRIFTCIHCGHFQMFSFPGEKPPPAWPE